MANPYALDFNPLASAITDNQQLDMARNRLAMDQKRLGFEEKRLGWEGELQPLRLTQARLGNESAQQGITREREMLPLDIQGRRLSISGQGLQNQSTAQSIEGKRMELEKELAGRIAGIAQMWEGKPEDQQKVMLEKLYGADKRFRGMVEKYIPKEVAGDPVVVGRTLRALAAGYQAPQAMKVGKDEALVNVQRNPNDPTAPASVTPVYKNEGNDAFKDEHQLRGELSQQPTIKNFSEIKSGFQRMTEGKEVNNNQGSGAGDLAIVYGYMKMLDPTSVVREGEFATAENTAGIPQRILGYYNKAISGERLPPKVREEFMTMAGGLYQRNMADVTKLQEQYRALAIRNKLRPENVILDLGMAAKPQQGPPVPRFNPAPQGMQDVINGRGIQKPAQERLPQSPVPRVTNDQEYNAIPPGTQYMAPDGSMRTKR